MGVFTSRPFKLAVFSVALVGAAFVLLFSASVPAHDKPRAQWNPASVNETIQPGQTRVIPVTLTADKNLPDTVVHISPELAPYVIISPTAIGKTHKGTTVSLTLTVSVPIDALPATTTGLIELQKTKQQSASDNEEDDQERNGKEQQEKKIGTSLPVSLNVVWQKSTVGNVSVSYPPTLQADASPEYHSIQLYVPGGPAGVPRPQITIETYDNPGGLSLMEFLESPNSGLSSEFISGAYSVITVNGHQAYRFLLTDVPAVVVVISTPGKFIVVTDAGSAFQATGEFAKILSGIVVGG